MSSVSGRERGQKGTISRRVGREFRSWGGINTQGDPASIGENEFQQAINVESRGEKLIEAPGLAKANTGGALTGTIYGIFDSGSYSGASTTTDTGGVRTPPQLNFVINGINDPSIYAYDPVSDGLVVPIQGTGNLLGSGLGKHAGDLVIGHNVPNSYSGVVSRLHPAGAVTETVFAHDSIAATSAEQTFSLASLQGTLHVGKVASNGVTEAIYCDLWNGTSASTETIITPSSSVAGVGGTAYPRLLTYREDVLCAFTAIETGAVLGYETPGTPIIKYRNGGAWTSMTIPAALTKFSCRAACAYKDVAYFAGYGKVSGTFSAVIVSVTGTTVAVARTITGTTNFVTTLTVFNGKLHYGLTSGNIGTYDGSSWSDAAGTLSSYGAPSYDGDLHYVALGLREYRNELQILFKATEWSLYRTVGQSLGSLTLVVSRAALRVSGGYTPQTFDNQMEAL